jgi:hypothetical protein
MSRSARPLLVLTFLLGVIWAGCDTESGFLLPNEAPNTRISSGPPESRDTGYQVDLYWYGWDNDGYVDHYEIAWETPENWIGPIYAVDSTFSVRAADSCCVPPLPSQATALQDSVFEQYHTFYVRAVDNQGVPDESPSFRTFNAKTLAPHTEISYGPSFLGNWGNQVTFKWRGTDPDGAVTSYRYALTSLFDFARDQGDTNPTIGRLLAWVDSITYYPRQGGGYNTDSLVWRTTVEDSIVFRNVLTTAGIPPPQSKNKIVFAVRAVDNADAVEQVLTVPANVVVFDVLKSLNGPCISVTSNIVGTWNCFTARVPREIFSRRGLKFSWTATPGGSQTPVAGYSYAVDDTAGTSAWSPFSLNTREYPEQVDPNTETLWYPEAGAHTLFLRAVDQAGFVNVLPINLQVFDGPTFCPAPERYILVVLDTDPADLIQGSRVFPSSYRSVERGLIQYFFVDQGYNILVHETRGTDPPDVSLLNCASSTFWFLSTDAAPGGDSSVLASYHIMPPNVLPSYVASFGNLFLCGIEPVNAMRYTESHQGVITLMQNPPFRFDRTLADTSLVDHWLATQFGIAQIEETISKDDLAQDPSKRFSVATSQIRTGPNPYPDLHFDPLSWPGGPQTRGFAFYDVGIIPLPDSTLHVQVIYTLNDTGRAVAVRRLNGPGPTGNVVYAGFHPYFIQKAEYREFLRAVLTDFGEVPSP